MKNLYLIALASLFLTACSVKTFPLKNPYPGFETVTDNTKETVWNKTIDWLAKKGMAIRLVDKSSGLVISEPVPVSFTFEDKNGRLMNPNALVVLPKNAMPGRENPIRIPKIVKGEWDIRIRENANGKTVININIVNIQRIKYRYYMIVTPLPGARSTGFIPKDFIDEIK